MFIIYHDCQVFKAFHRMGLCQSDSAARDNVDKLAQECDKQLHTWKTNIEVTTPEYPVPSVADALSLSIQYFFSFIFSKRMFMKKMKPG